LTMLILTGALFSSGQSVNADDEHGCKALGKKYEKSLDEHTKIGRVAWSPRIDSCIAESINIESGTEMYSITSLPSGKNLGTSGGLTSWLDKDRDKETARRDFFWNNLLSPKKN
jgi:hypothetical protein